MFVKRVMFAELRQLKIVVWRIPKGLFTLNIRITFLKENALASPSGPGGGVSIVLSIAFATSTR
jgi:hypothetical protein